MTVIPRPTAVRDGPGPGFRLSPDTAVVVDAGRPGAGAAAAELVDLLRPPTGYPLPLVVEADRPAISLEIEPSDDLGPEGYRLESRPEGVTLRAAAAAGLFYGVQTLRQLLPASVEERTVRPGPWVVPPVQVTDVPRFRWRGAMLDVARHFFGVADVKRYVDLLAMYKVNVLHLHLADDQGWRIQVDSWPRLTRHGGSTQVGGGPGGFYTKQEFAELVAYAAARHVMVLPEIDMPGHVNAALASYPELTCDGVAPPLYTGTDVGISSLCVDKPVVHRFVDDVVRELAELSPSPYLHLGGDEALATSHDGYVAFENRVGEIVAAHGRTMVGWEEIGAAALSSPTVAQHWWDESRAREAAAKGLRLVVSPASRAYLDMAYDETTRLGTSWAGHISVRQAYEWDPGTCVPGVPASAVLGLEAPLWTETVATIRDLEYLAFPRMAGIAELGWSQPEGRSWAEYRQRLGEQAPRWDALSVAYYRSPEVPWTT